MEGPTDQCGGCWSSQHAHISEPQPGVPEFSSNFDQKTAYIENRETSKDGPSKEYLAQRLHRSMHDRFWPETKHPVSAAYIAEVTREESEYSGWHIFPISDGTIGKHLDILQDRSTNNGCVSRVVLLEDLNPAAVLCIAQYMDINPQAFALHLLTETLEKRRREDFSSIWKQNSGGILAFCDDMNKQGMRVRPVEPPAEDPFRLNKHILRIRVPTVALCSKTAREETQSNRVPVALPQHNPFFPCGEPSLFLHRGVCYGDVVDNLEELLMLRYDSPARDHVPTVIIFRRTSVTASEYPGFSRNDRLSESHSYADSFRLSPYCTRSDPWSETPFGYTQSEQSSSCHTSSMVIVEGLSKTLMSAGEALHLECRGSGLVSVALFYMVREIIPYIWTLLAFEESFLRFQGEEGEEQRRTSGTTSSAQHRILQRAERKLAEMRSSLDSAEFQLTFLGESMHTLRLWEDMPGEIGFLHTKLDTARTRLVSATAYLKKQNEHWFKDLQIELTKTQIAESRQAIAQANTVAKLTILAFVFIPISAVSGIFGMNVSEIADGTHLWMFGASCGTVLGLTLLFAFSDSILCLLQAVYEDQITPFVMKHEYKSLVSYANYIFLIIPVGGVLFIWYELGSVYKRLSKLRDRGDWIRRQQPHG